MKEEIEEGLISERTIDRCCPEEWKRKTRPKPEERQMSFFEGQKEPKQETVTNTNTNVTSGGQVLQQEFDPDESKKVEEQKPEGTKIQRVAQIPGEQESEEMQRLKMENKGQKEKIESLLKEIDKLKEQGDVWTANGIVQMGKIQLPLILTVNTKQKKIESVELDREAIKTLKIS